MPALSATSSIASTARGVGVASQPSLGRDREELTAEVDVHDAERHNVWTVEFRKGVPFTPRGLQASQVVELNLSGQGLTDISGLEALPQLCTLVAKFNKLLALPDLSMNAALAYVNFDHNLLGASDEPLHLEQLGSLPKLERLSLAHNRIGTLAGLPPCKALQELCVAHNALNDLTALGVVLAAQPVLATLVVEGNPCLSRLPPRSASSAAQTPTLAADGTDPEAVQPD
ncbi:Dnaaf1, partial [Symbiodinium sp. KB8]